MIVVKRYLAWSLAVIALVGVCVSYYGIWVLVAYFAAGLVWWGEAALLCSGPIGAIGALFAWVKPRQRIAMILGLIAFAAWVLLWVLMFTVLGFGFLS
jgi:hypothetical protein